MATLYTPRAFTGVVSHTPSGAIYSVQPGQTISVVDSDVQFLLGFGFSVSAVTSGNSFITLTDGTNVVPSINTIDFTSGATVSAAGGGVADVDIESGSTGTVTNIQISGGTTGLTVSGGPITGAGTFTVGGTLAQANGGTGLTSLTGLMALQNSGTVAITGGTITGMLNPSAASDVANKSYVDATVNGLQVKPTAALATAAALPSNVYNNGASGVGATLTGVGFGALTVDGQTVTVGQIILVKNEVASANNGLYVVTTVGAVATLYVLTRHVDMNVTAEFSGAFVPVGNLGTSNPNTLWLANPTTPVTVGTTSIPFTQLNSPTALFAGLGININGSTISSHSQVTVAATAGTNALTVALSTTSELLNGPSAGGAVTLTCGSLAADQSFKLIIKQGATPATWTLGTGFNLGTLTYTATAVANQFDVLMVISNLGSIGDVMAIAQGFTA